MNSLRRKVNQTFRPLPRRTGRGRNPLVAALAIGVVAGFVPGAMSASAAPVKSAPVTGGDSLWSASAARAQAKSDGNTRRVNPSDYAAFTLEGGGMRSLLAKAPDEAADAAGQTVAVPAPTGELMHFRVSDSPIMESKLAARNPDIMTYAGRGIEDPATTIRLDYTKTGFHASVRGPVGQNSWYVDPAYNGGESDLYLSYFGDDLPEPKSLEEKDPIAAVDEVFDAAKIPLDGSEVQRTYRLAFLTDPSYATYFGTENVLSEKVTLMNRVNQIYNDDFGVKMVLINDSDKLNLDTDAKALGANGPCGSAPCFTTDDAGVSQFSNGCTGGLLRRNRIAIGQLVGAENYDIGHIGLGINGGGVASLGVVGGNSKAQGCTGLPQPEGDFYAVDYVAHEMGHQYSGNHTFGGNQWNCAGNGSANTSVEPGSGSSVMAYAGICQQDNLQPHSDPYFSQRSISEMTAFILNPRPNQAGCANPVDVAGCRINDVQTVSLYSFDGTDSFTLSVTDPEDGQVRTTAPIVRGTNYDTAGIKAAIEAVLPAVNGVPANVTVAAWGGSGTLNDTGFQVTFGSTNTNYALNRLSGLDIARMGLNPVDGDVTGFTGTTAQGGPIQNGGFIITPNGNSAPSVGAPAAKTIPVRTPFALTGSGTDADGDTLTYSWEQNNRRGASGTALVNNTKVDGPLFRQFEAYAPVTPAGTLEIDSPGENHAGTSPTRVFPDMKQILENNTNALTGACPAAPAAPASGGASNVPVPTVECFAEFLPTADYVGSTPGGNDAPVSLDFRLTARDGNADGGGTGFADVKLTLDKTAGPFQVSSKNSPAAAIAGRGELISWAVNNTTALAPNVKISLSTDGGETFPTTLVEETANDGSETVFWPNVATDHARIKIEAVDNYFFDVNNADFEIVPRTVVENDAEGEVSVQYSDTLDEPITVSAEDGSVDGADLTASASGLPAGLTLEEGESSAAGVRPGTKTWTVEGAVTAAPGTYPVTVTVSGGVATEETSFNVVVTEEDATVEQAGPTSVVTHESEDGMATVPLTAHVHEVDDGEAGDVTNATVTFLDADDEVVCEDVPVSATEVKGADAAKHELAGEAVCEADVPVTEGETTSYDFSMVIGGYYTGAPAEGSVDVTLDTTAPSTTIESGPLDGSFVLKKSVTFEFGSDDPAASFDCLFDGASADCASGSFTTAVSAGTHALEVRARDEVGNVDQTPVTRTFTRPNGIGVFTKDSDWTKGKSKGAYGGKFLRTTTKGAVLSYDVSNAHRVALVGQTGPGMGKVRVFLKGTPLGTVVFNDPGGDTQGKQLFVLEVPETMSGPLVIVTSNRKPVRIEGVGVQTQP